MQCKHAAGRKHCETFLLSGPTFISDYFCIQSRSPLRDKCITTISLLALKMTLWRCQLFMKLQFMVYRILHYFPPKTIYFLNACHLGHPDHPDHPDHLDHLHHLDHLDYIDHLDHPAPLGTLIIPTILTTSITWTTWTISTKWFTCFPLFVLLPSVCHRRGISTFLDNLMVKTI